MLSLNNLPHHYKFSSRKASAGYVVLQRKEPTANPGAALMHDNADGRDARFYNELRKYYSKRYIIGIFFIRAKVNLRVSQC